MSLQTQVLSKGASALNQAVKKGGENLTKELAEQAVKANKIDSSAGTLEDIANTKTDTIDIAGKQTDEATQAAASSAGDELRSEGFLKKTWNFITLRSGYKKHIYRLGDVTANQVNHVEKVADDTVKMTVKGVNITFKKGPESHKILADFDYSGVAEKYPKFSNAEGVEIKNLESLPAPVRQELENAGLLTKQADNAPIEGAADDVAKQATKGGGDDVEAPGNKATGGDENANVPNGSANDESAIPAQKEAS